MIPLVLTDVNRNREPGQGVHMGVETGAAEGTDTRKPGTFTLFPPRGMR